MNPLGSPFEVFQECGKTCTNINKIWSGIRESNPRLDLGKVAYYHYTNPALGITSRQAFIYSMAPEPGQDPPGNAFRRSDQ